MKNRNQDISYFLSFCIEQYKNAKGIDGVAVMKDFFDYGVLDYLSENFDVLHTQSYQWLIEDIDEFIDIRKREYESWVDFVMQNRTQKDFKHDYDMVYGPVANDRVYAAFALYEGGLIDKQILISELKTYKLVDQYLFHTDKSLRTIGFVEAKEIVL